MTAKRATVAIFVMALVALILPPDSSDARPAHVPLRLGAAQTESRAALIIQFGDGSYVTRCVSFDGGSIAGLELLTRSGLQVALWGGAVCRIQDEGCDFPTQPCFCQCKGSSCQYWSYWHWRDDHWAYSQIGSGDYPIHDGDVDAWLWGNAQTPPVALAFAEICRPSGGTGTALRATPARPEDDESQVPSAQPSRQSMPLTQYAVFLIMAMALVAGLWFRRRAGS